MKNTHNSAYGREYSSLGGHCSLYATPFTAYNRSMPPWFGLAPQTYRGYDYLGEVVPQIRESLAE